MFNPNIGAQRFDVSSAIREESEEDRTILLEFYSSYSAYASRTWDSLTTLFLQAPFLLLVIVLVSFGVRYKVSDATLFIAFGALILTFNVVVPRLLAVVFYKRLHQRFKKMIYSGGFESVTDMEQKLIALARCDVRLNKSYYATYGIQIELLEEKKDSIESPVFWITRLITKHPAIMASMLLITGIVLSILGVTVDKRISIFFTSVLGCLIMGSYLVETLRNYRAVQAAFLEIENRPKSADV